MSSSDCQATSPAPSSAPTHTGTPSLEILKYRCLTEWCLSDLDFSAEPPLRLHDGPISFDGGVQYGGRSPEQELLHLESGEAAAYSEALAEQGLPASTTTYPFATTVPEAADILAKIKRDEVKLWDGLKGRQVPAVSKGIDGTSELHVASLPGADPQVYNDIVLASLELKISFGVVWEANWNDLWFCVWKQRQREAHLADKHFLVLTKEDGSVGFNQSIEVGFLKREKIPFRSIRARSLLGQLRPMVQAAGYKNNDLVAKLLEHPDAKHFLEQTESSGLTTLAVLAQKGQAKLVGRALAVGAVVDAAGFCNETALWNAAECGQEEVAAVLLEAGAAVNQAERNGQTPLSKAAEKGHVSLLRLLIAAGGDLDQPALNGATPLIWAAQGGQDGTAAALVAARADVEQCADNQATPLYMASLKGHATLVKILLEAQADPTRESFQGRTALACAQAHGHKEVEALLLAQG